MDDLDLAIFDPTLSSNTEENNIGTAVKNQGDLLQKIQNIASKNKNDAISKESLLNTSKRFNKNIEMEENSKSLFDSAMENELRNFGSALDNRFNDPWGNDSGILT